jgi:outer membrane protein OmpA-like peptidoglycan-associated protein
MAIFDAENEDYWIPLADIMTGLMLIFLLIATSFMIKVRQENQELRSKYVQNNSIVMNNLMISKSLANSLNNEFGADLPIWQASFESQNLTIRFNAPGVLFDTGQATLKPEFMQILHNFFPRYLSVLQSSPYADQIAEIRIDGYTSSIWSKTVNKDAAYFLNMQLSQQRTMSVLQYVYYMTNDDAVRQYVHNHFTANGLSSSHLIINPDGSENSLKSQRVEFKILLKGEPS